MVGVVLAALILVGIVGLGIMSVWLILMESSDGEDQVRPTSPG